MTNKPCDYAFPGTHFEKVKSFDHTEFVEASHPGMTLRDYFAAKQMNFYLGKVTPPYEDYHYENAARCSYLMADAMLKARNL